MNLQDVFGLQGQVAIVTGGGAGIGRGIAELFAQAGAAVVVSDLKKETADAVAQAIVAAGGRAVGVACDVASDAARQELVNAAQAAFGQINMLVNDVHQGRGIGSELVRGLIQVGRDEKLEVISAIMSIENKEMQRMVERLGFTLSPLDEKMIRAEMTL